MAAVCWECGDYLAFGPNSGPGCEGCSRQGYRARVGSATTGSSAPRRQNKKANKWTTNRNTCAANPHRLPLNWKVSTLYGATFEEAIAGLAAKGRQHTLENVEWQEFKAIEELVQRTWDGRRVGIGVDGANLDHSAIQVVSIQRIENPSLYERYSLVKQELLQVPRNERASTYPPVEQIPGGTRPIWTTRALKPGSFLRQNFFQEINEHYLFHGTKEGNVKSIAENGFNMDFSLDRGLMGAGIYFAESSTKADMYADLRHKRTQGLKHMFLVRVLLGRSYVNTVKEKIALDHPPCRGCLQHDCTCGEEDYFDSVVDDSRRLFRVFAVYESDLCYPEYLITYQRVYEDEEDDGDDVNYDVAAAFMHEARVPMSSTSSAAGIGTRQFSAGTGNDAKPSSAVTVTSAPSASAPSRQLNTRIPSPVRSSTSAVPASPATRGLDRDLYDWSSTSDRPGRSSAASGSSLWSIPTPSRPQPKSESFQWSYATTSRPQPKSESFQWSYSTPSRPQPASGSSDHAKSTSSSRGILGLIWDFFFG